MLNKMIKKTLIIVLSAMVALATAGCGMTNNNSSVVVDATVSATEISDTEDVVKITNTAENTTAPTTHNTESTEIVETEPTEENTMPTKNYINSAKTNSKPTKSSVSKTTESSSTTSTTANNTKKEEITTTSNPVATTPMPDAPAKSPTVNNRDKVTMIDLNKGYVDNKIYYTNISTIEEYIAKTTIQKVKMPDEFKDTETALLNALNGSDNEFSCIIPNCGSDFINAFVINHITYGDCKSSLFYQTRRNSDGSFTFKVDLNAARKSIEDNKIKWNNKISKQQEAIDKKIAVNDEYDRLNNTYKNKVYECIVAAGVKKGMTVEDAIVKIHNYICKINQYDYTYTNYDFYDIFDYGTSTCNGYAHLFFLMAQRCGIDVEMVTSKSMNHIWNVVHFDGKTLYVDATWSDTGSKNYCLLTKEEMSKNHTFSDVIIKDELNVAYY